MSREHKVFRSGWSAIVRFLRLGVLAATALGGAAALVASTPAEAVPSFARQTGMACEACHTVFPELTPFGRRFKLNGYTLTTTPDGVSDINQAKERVLALAPFPPLSFLFQASYDRWARAPIDANGLPGQTDTAQFPDAMTIMYGGRVTDHIGAWIQLTYTQNSGTIGIDTTEVRYSDHNADSSLVWGVLANNSVGMQDVWNTGWWSLPAFSMESLYVESPNGVGGLTGPIISSFATNVAGVGAYVFYNDAFYLEGAVYRSACPGTINSAQDSTNLATCGGIIQGAAPYWRAAYELDWGKNSLSVGTTGMYVDYIPCVGLGSIITNPGACSVDGINPESASGGPGNRYLDVGGDWQYQYIGDNHIFSLAGHYMHEHVDVSPLFITNGEYSNTTDYLDQFVVTASYYYQRRFGGYVSFVSTTGSNDPALLGGNGSPNNQYEVFEFDYMPWLNTKFLVQYDLYNRVANNQSPFYPSGYATKASDNNTIVGGLWMAF
ncbi:MAG: hypothetical protein WCF20_13835 [Methylovirgula sp.]